jgi:hypothetical protein
MEWTHNVPTEVGFYLRQNPRRGCFSPIPVPVYEIEGELRITNAGGSRRLSQWHNASFHLWYGPIKPPEKHQYI